MGRWFGKITIRDTPKENGIRTAETEIDELCVDRMGENYLVGECKFKGVPFSYSEYLDTLVKLTPLKEKAEFYYALFSESGFDEKIVNDAEKMELRFMTLKLLLTLIDQEEQMIKNDYLAVEAESETCFLLLKIKNG